MDDRGVGSAVEGLLDGGFEERPFLLDDDQLVETVREVDDGVAFEGKIMPSLRILMPYRARSVSVRPMMRRASRTSR